MPPPLHLLALVVLTVPPAELWPGPEAAPPITELSRFPSEEDCRGMIRQTTHERHLLCSRAPSPDVDNEFRFNAYQERCWKLLLKAHDPCRRDVKARRAALHELRQLLGEADWRRGRMPGIRNAPANFDIPAP